MSETTHDEKSNAERIRDDWSRVPWHHIDLAERIARELSEQYGRVVRRAGNLTFDEKTGVVTLRLEVGERPIAARHTRWADVKERRAQNATQAERCPVCKPSPEPDDWYGGWVQEHVPGCSESLREASPSMPDPLLPRFNLHMEYEFSTRQNMAESITDEDEG